MNTVRNTLSLSAIAATLLIGQSANLAVASTASKVDSSIAGYEVSVSPTAGVFLATETVASLSCTGKETGELVSTTQVFASIAYTTTGQVRYVCAGGTAPDIYATLYNNVGDQHPKSVTVEPGDRVLTVIRYGSGTHPGHVTVSMNDLTSMKKISISEPHALTASGILVGEIAEDPTIPTFTAIHWSGITWNGSSLGSQSNLQEFVMANKNGRPMATTGLLSKEGTGFSSVFRRNGVGSW